MNNSLRHFRHQSGLSLVELMVSLVIGLILLGAVISLVVTARQTDRGQQALSRIQENSRYAFDVVGGVVRRAGYRVDGTQPPTEAFTAATINSQAFVAGQKIGGTDTTLIVRYQGAADGLTQNCLGATVASGALVSETITLSGTELRCQVDTGTAQAMVDGIENIRFTYGEDTSGDLSADVYRADAAAVVSWPDVVAVRVEILLVSDDDNVTTAPQAFTFNSTATTPTDKRLRRVTTTTFARRN